MRRKIIIGLNLYFILEAVYLLLSEYLSSLQPHEPEPICSDNRTNLFVIGLFILFVTLGIISIFFQLITGRERFRKGINKYLISYFIEPVSILYAIAGALSGVAYLIFGTASLIHKPGDLEHTMFGVLELLPVAGFAGMGILTLLEVRSHNVPQGHTNPSENV